MRVKLDTLKIRLFRPRCRLAVHWEWQRNKGRSEFRACEWRLRTSPILATGAWKKRSLPQDAMGDTKNKQAHRCFETRFPLKSPLYIQLRLAGLSIRSFGSQLNVRISVLDLDAYDTILEPKNVRTPIQKFPRSSRYVHPVATSILGFRSWAWRPTILYLRSKKRPNAEPQGTPGGLETIIR